MQDSQIISLIEVLQKKIDDGIFDPREGLPEELFILVTELVPCANVDLLIIDDNMRVLLSWRDDDYYGAGWHIPGGCLRIKESLEERVQKTAMEEIGTEVIIVSDSFVTRETIVDYDRPLLRNNLERSHNISMLFRCKLPVGFSISNIENDEHTVGYLKWFDFYPDDLIQMHKDLYGDILEEIWRGKS